MISEAPTLVAKHTQLLFPANCSSNTVSEANTIADTAAAAFTAFPPRHPRVVCLKRRSRWVQLKQLRQAWELPLACPVEHVWPAQQHPLISLPLRLLPLLTPASRHGPCSSPHRCFKAKHTTPSCRPLLVVSEREANRTHGRRPHALREVGDIDTCIQKCGL